MREGREGRERGGGGGGGGGGEALNEQMPTIYHSFSMPAAFGVKKLIAFPQVCVCV